MPKGSQRLAGDAVFAVLAIAGLVFLTVGTKLVLDQRTALENVRPVAAVIVGRDIEEHHTNGNHGYAYRPVVRFQYHVGATIRMGDQVGPVPESRGGHWAWQVLDRYQVGQHVTAWVRTDVVDRAYLERTPSRQPYTMMVFGAAFTVFIAFVWMRLRVKGRMLVTGRVSS